MAQRPWTDESEPLKDAARVLLIKFRNFLEARVEALGEGAAEGEHDLEVIRESARFRCTQPV